MKVKADLAKNRLYLKMTGEMSKKELEKVYTEVRFCVADLQHSFSVIADYSESNLVKLNGLSTYRKLMNYLIKNGVGEVVRVIEDKSLLYKQVRNLSARICGYKPSYARSLEEAEKILNASIKRKGLRFHYSDLPSAEIIVNDTKGTGQLLNLSTSGCAVGTASICPSVGEDIIVKMVFSRQDDSLHDFTIKARVVRTNEIEFAAEFQDFEDEQKDQLLSCLLRETEREL
jgi:hypothetical protein